MATLGFRKSVQSRMFVVVMLVIAGCAATLPEQGKLGDEPLQQDEGIVFGSLVTTYYTSKGEQLSVEDAPKITYEVYVGTARNILAKQLFPVFPLLHIALLAPPNTILGSTRDREILFVKRLAADEYSLHRVNLSLPHGSGSMLTDIRFSVTPNKATYIGSLHFEFHGERGLFGEGVGSRVVRRVVDDLDTVKRMYSDRNPGSAYDIISNLMRIEK